MFDWNVWIRLAQRPPGPSFPPELMGWVRTLCAAAEASGLAIEPRDPLLEVGGVLLFQAHSAHNRRLDRLERLTDVLRSIAELLPAAHGLCYWNDDEIPGNGRFDGYHVIVIARGALTHRYDPFLSPTFTTVESFGDGPSGLT